MKLLGAVPSTTRVSENSGTTVVGRTSHDHVLQFNLITGSHDCQVGDATHVRKIVASMVGRSVVSDHSGSVENHAHRQILDGNVVNNLVVTTLHKSGVDADERFQSLARHTCSHGDGMLLSNTNVEGSLGEATSEDIHSGTARHGSGDSDNGPVLGGGIDQRVCKNRSEGRSDRLTLHLGTGSEVELSNSVHPVACLLSWRIAVSLDGLEVKKNWLVIRAVAELLQDWNEVVQIVSIDRSNVVESELLKESTTRNDSTCVLIETLVDALDVLGQKLVETLGKGPEILEGLGNEKVRRVGGQLGCWNCASSAGCSGGETDLSVVVEDDNHAGTQVPGTVHGFVGHSSGNGSVSDDGDAIVATLVQQLLGDTHSLRSRDGGRRVSRSERVVFTLLALAESRDTAKLSKGWEFVLSSGEDLVGVALMRNIPDNVVFGHVKHIVQGDRQLVHAKRRTQVTSSFRHRFECVPSELVCKLMCGTERQS